MSLYYNLTVLTFKNGCSQLVEKAEYISECLYTLQDCCKSAVSETIHHFGKCENNTQYLCEYKTKALNDADATIMFLYGILGGATFWLFLSFLKFCYSTYCVKKNEYSLEDLDDDEEYP